jgi:RNA polymerase sigma factor (sigma-70 family)
MEESNGSGLAAALVRGIRREEPTALARLYAELNLWSGGIAAQGVEAADVEDLISNTFVSVVDSVRAGRLRDPNALFGFARTVLNRAVISHAQALSRRRPMVDLESEDTVRGKSAGPDQILLARERSDAFLRAFLSLRAKDREILVRFYLSDQTESQISEAMGLTATQYRLLKSRAKDRLGRAVERFLAGRRDTASVPGGRSDPAESISRIRDAAQAIAAAVPNSHHAANRQRTNGR